MSLRELFMPLATRLRSVYWPASITTCTPILGLAIGFDSRILFPSSCGQFSHAIVHRSTLGGPINAGYIHPVAGTQDVARMQIGCA